MSVTIFDLPKYILQYMSSLALDPKDTSNSRATCKHMHDSVQDTAEAYRTCDNMDAMLHVAFNFDHPNIADWAVSNGGRYCIGGCLTVAACNGSLKMAKWSASKGATNFDDSLHYACYYGYLDIAKWSALKGATKFDLAMRHACITKRLDIAKWCVSKGATDFERALKLRHYGDCKEIIDWLKQQITNKKRKLK